MNYTKKLHKEKLLVYYLYFNQVNTLHSNFQNLLLQKNFKINTSLYSLNCLNRLFIYTQIQTHLKLQILHYKDLYFKLENKHWNHQDSIPSPISNFFLEVQRLESKWHFLPSLFQQSNELKEPFSSNFSFIHSISPLCISRNDKLKLLNSNPYRTLPTLESYDLTNFNEFVEDYSKLLKVKDWEVKFNPKKLDLSEPTLNYFSKVLVKTPKIIKKSNLKGLSLSIRGRLKGARRARNYGYTYGTIGPNSLNQRSKTTKEPIFTKWGIWNLKISLSRNIDQLRLL